jgi:hypothetical protein
MKQPDNHLFKLIGERLRSDWREIETAPLPVRITMLLEQLKRREASAPARRQAVNVTNAATCIGEGEGSARTAAPLTVRDRQMALAEA